jgi:hypothetical protein
LNEKKFLNKFKNTQIIFFFWRKSLRSHFLLKRSFQKLCSKKMLSSFTWIRLNFVSSIKMINDTFVTWSRYKVIIEKTMRMSKLMNFDVEINVMTRRLMNKVDIIMRSDFRLRLIFHIEHDKNFDDVCNDVELNIKKMKTRHHVFVVVHVDHQFVLKQSFFIDFNVNYDYHFDEVYVVLTNLYLNWSIIFKALNKYDAINRIEENVFLDDDQSLNWMIDVLTKKRCDRRKIQSSSRSIWNHLT